MSQNYVFYLYEKFQYCICNNKKIKKFRIWFPFVIETFPILHNCYRTTLFIITLVISYNIAESRQQDKSLHQFLLRQIAATFMRSLHRKTRRDFCTKRFAITAINQTVNQSSGLCIHYTQRNLFESLFINLKSECIYHFPIDLEPNGRPFGSKLIGKW